MKRNDMPSEKDFARASAAMKHSARGLSQVRENILKQFGGAGEIQEFFVINCSDGSFRVLVFYRWDKQIMQAQKSGLEARFVAAVYDELEKAGRGDREVIKVDFEFDSQENVEANFKGDYFLRLR